MSDKDIENIEESKKVLWGNFGLVKWHSRKGIVTYFGRLTWVPFQYPGRYVSFGFPKKP